jgi:hypothetical protein
VADNTPTAAFDIEMPACFYLGREYDLDQKAVLSDKYVLSCPVMHLSTALQPRIFRHF